MPKEGPLCRAEERMGFHIRGASAGANAPKFIFDEKFTNEGLAQTEAN